MASVFLSYSRTDGDAVAPLVAALRAGGVTVFQDTRDTRPFEPIHDWIIDRLELSAALLAWYSRDLWVETLLPVGTDRGMAGRRGHRQARAAHPGDQSRIGRRPHPARGADRLAAGPDDIARPEDLARKITAERRYAEPPYSTRVEKIRLRLDP